MRDNGELGTSLFAALSISGLQSHEERWLCVASAGLWSVQYEGESNSTYLSGTYTTDRDVREAIGSEVVEP